MRKCRIGTAKFFTLLLLLYNTSANTDGTNYYDEAVAWANSQKLLDGTAVPFAPDNLSPRADIVTYLYRVLGK